MQMRDDVSSFKFDLTKTDKEIFEDHYILDDEAKRRFGTWDESEQLYTDPQVCFAYQTIKIGIKMARIVDMLEKQIANGETEK